MQGPYSGAKCLNSLVAPFLHLLNAQMVSYFLIILSLHTVRPNIPPMARYQRMFLCEHIQPWLVPQQDTYKRRMMVEGSRSRLLPEDIDRVVKMVGYICSPWISGFHLIGFALRPMRIRKVA